MCCIVRVLMSFTCDLAVKKKESLVLKGIRTQFCTPIPGMDLLNPTGSRWKCIVDLATNYRLLISDYSEKPLLYSAEQSHKHSGGATVAHMGPTAVCWVQQSV